MKIHHLSDINKHTITAAGFKDFPAQTKKGKVMNYDEAMAYIDYTNTLGSVPGLTSIKELLRRLGNPQDKRKVIHIAGTNGKGSICAFLEDILLVSGYKVGRYISPTIFTYLERFQINKEYMDEEAFAKVLTAVKSAADAMVADGFDRPTSFETETAVAMCYFLQEKVDFVLLEAGMGGLLDATNVCKKPLCTIIASISLDHVDFLGNTLEEIYSHKLGIMREGVPCVSYPVDKELMPMWKECIRRLKVEDSSLMLDAGDVNIIRCDEDGSEYTYMGNRYRLSVPGEYQIYNSLVAVCAAKVLQKQGFDITQMDIENGIMQTVWKGRFQKINESPLIYVDGAHNPGGWSALKRNIELYFKRKRLIYVCGVFKDKDYEQMLRVLMPGAWACVTVASDNPRALDRDILADLVKGYIDKVYSCGDLTAAVKKAALLAKAAEKSEGEAAVIIIFGSLSFMGPIINKAELGDFEEIYEDPNEESKCNCS